jgi:hypothetical protein
LFKLNTSFSNTQKIFIGQYSKNIYWSILKKYLLVNTQKIFIVP